MQRVSQWPIGDLEGTDVLGLKITETLAHGWHLQQALGTQIDFDPSTIAGSPRLEAADARPRSGRAATPSAPPDRTAGPTRGR